jgi:polyhydroxybutyrate depolymerase
MVPAFARTAWAARIAGLCLCLVLAVVTGACSGETKDTAVTADAGPSPSSGCDGSTPSHSGTVSLRHDGMDRSYELVVPDMRPGVPVPLVLGFHGYTGSPQEAALSGLALRALQDGFVAVLPYGSDVDGSTPRYFNIETSDEPLLADDIGFTQAILDDVEADLCIDRTRIYAMGMSNGGMFVSTLACALGERIAAVAPVAGVHVASDCAGRPVPIIATHGTSDVQIPFAESDVGRFEVSGLFEQSAGAQAQRRMFEQVYGTSATSWVESWARHNGCNLDSPEVATVGSAVERTAYVDCDDGADVMLQAVVGGGHDWPTSPTLDATARALAFFQDHPLPRNALEG